MNRQKPPPPATDKVRPQPSRTPAPAENLRLSQDQRWQRTVHCNWDNGGKRGGNKDGRK